MKTALKTILITGPIALALGFYAATWMATQPKTPTAQKQASLSISNPTQMMTSTAHKGVTDYDNDVEQLKIEIINLKTEMAALKKEVHNIPLLKSVQASSNKPSIEKLTPPSEEEMRAEEDKYFAAQSAALETDFRQQSINPIWSSQAETLIKKSLASDKITGNAIIGVECRARTCRMELANNSKNQAPNLVEFPQQIAAELSNMMVSQTESTEDTTVFYLAKEEFNVQK